MGWVYDQTLVWSNSIIRHHLRPLSKSWAWNLDPEHQTGPSYIICKPLWSMSDQALTSSLCWLWHDTTHYIFVFELYSYCKRKWFTYVMVNTLPQICEKVAFYTLKISLPLNQKGISMCFFSCPSTTFILSLSMGSISIIQTIKFVYWTSNSSIFWSWLSYIFIGFENFMKK